VDEVVARPWISRRHLSRKQHLTALGVAVLQNGEATITVDSYGRVHSPVTNLRRTVRPALRIYGQALMEIDVASAQPLILGFTIGQILTGAWSLDEVRRLGAKGAVTGPFASLPMVGLTGTLPTDLRDFIAICEQGRFYQEMANAWNLPCDTPRSRNEVKRLVFKAILFGRVRHGRPHWEMFRSRWPSVACVLEEIKRDDHGTSARCCQRIEARLMIESVAGCMKERHPDVPLQTIHDSALTGPDGLEIVHNVMEAEWRSLGLNPMIKPKVRQAQ
jgi:hypothetical protein